MMEESIAHSIENNKASIVTSLYPVVGSLVRKSVSVFFNSFIEKLNNLIEYSLTIKGIKWRFNAWKQGISFTQYVIKQSFVYRVEDVMLIHRETGTLLIDVASDHSDCNDPELMSAMLTAINDFMADSFQHDEEVLLDTIKTKNLTLTIASGPKAILVAAVSGMPPVELQEHLQQTLEEVHELLLDDLLNYSGDNANFVNAEPHLRSCLLSELNSDNQQQKKPVWGLALLLSALTLIVYQLFGYWQQQQLLGQINNLQPQSGIYIQKAYWHNDKLTLNVLRDPAAIPVNSWLEHQNVPTSQLNVNELAFASLDKHIILSKVKAILADEAVSFSLNKQNELLLTGDLASPLLPDIVNQLIAVPGLTAINTDDVNIKPNAAPDKQMQQYVLDQYIAKLAVESISFDVKSTELSPQSQTKLISLANDINNIEQLAETLDISIGVIVTGYSDSLGNAQQNQTHKP